MRRRRFLAAGSLGTMLATGKSWAISPHSLSSAAEEAYIYGAPLLETGASRAAWFATEGGAPNRIFHDRKLATPQFRSITTPNNDTLYSQAWLDLSAGAVTVDVPVMGDRYFSIAFLDMYGSNFAVIGSRTIGGDGGRYQIAGPDGGRAGFATITAPSNYVWMLVRTLADGEKDLSAVHALQDELHVIGPERPMPPRFAKRSAAWPELFASVQRLIAENMPPVTDELLLERFAPLGIGSQGEFDANRFSEAQGREIEAGVTAARKRLVDGRRQGAVTDGWIYQKANFGIWGDDYFYRAQIALAGLGALPQSEAMYMRAVDEGGRVFLAPGQSFEMHFDAGKLPPVKAFWSLSAYERTTEGQFFLIDNPIERYSIGDRTPGLQYESDGSLRLCISPDRPQGDRISNWLPAPVDKECGLVMRAYLPGEAMLEGDYHLPPILVSKRI